VVGGGCWDEPPERPEIVDASPAELLPELPDKDPAATRLGMEPSLGMGAGVFLG